jgi:hypothetical protein
LLSDDLVVRVVCIGRVVLANVDVMWLYVYGWREWRSRGGDEIYTLKEARRIDARAMRCLIV